MLKDLILEKSNFIGEPKVYDSNYIEFDDEEEAADVFTYNKDAMLFAWARKYKDKINIITTFEKCREEFTDQFMECLERDRLDSKSYKGIHTTNRRINKERTQFVILIDKYNCRKRIESAMNILNIIEEHYGWEKTNAYYVKSKSTTTSMNTIIFFDGCIKRIKSPHMISLLTLIIRSGKADNFVKQKTFKSLIGNIKKISNDLHIDIKLDGTYTPYKKDIINLCCLLRYTKVLMGDYNNLFRGFNKRYFCDEGEYGGSGEGIMVLCRDLVLKRRNELARINAEGIISSQYKIFLKRFMSMCKAARL